ncbi:MAG TPA: response regulator transcription factor [Pseudogracilibacillus sp.]|nr:response regulator transcription factor [Pseudogracilibacillus sp.]
MHKVMIVEDDLKIASLLEQAVQKYGYNTFVVQQFEKVLNDFKSFDPHIVLLDINLPSFDGYYWCRQIRQISTCPVIFISARTGQMDQVMALENGADDFITKPFHAEVVLAKINSQLRRAYGEYARHQSERIVEQAGLKLYPERLQLTYEDKVEDITKNEALILELILTRFPKVAGRDDLLEKIWDENAFVDENTLNVNITRVRKRLKSIGMDHAIETVRGVGYRFRVDE